MWREGQWSRGGLGMTEQEWLKSTDSDRMLVAL
jgi:hypothetical protein